MWSVPWRFFVVHSFPVEDHIAQSWPDDGEHTWSCSEWDIPFFDNRRGHEDSSDTPEEKDHKGSDRGHEVLESWDEHQEDEDVEEEHS